MQSVKSILFVAAMGLIVSACGTENAATTGADSAAASVSGARVSSSFAAPTDDAFGTSRQVYRFVNPSTGDHTYSLTPDQAAQNGLILEGGAFRLYVSSSPLRNAIYSCVIRSDGRQFASVDPGCEGQISLGLLGHANRNVIFENDRALYRCYNSQTGLHLITVSSSECQINNYKVEAFLGYVP